MYDRVDPNVVWIFLGQYRVHCRPGNQLKVFEGSKCYTGVGGTESDRLQIRVSLRKGRGVSPWLCGKYVDGVVKEV